MVNYLFGRPFIPSDFLKELTQGKKYEFVDILYTASTLIFDIFVLILHAQKYKFVDFLYTAGHSVSSSRLSSDSLSRNSCIMEEKHQKAKEIHGLATSEKIKYRQLALLKKGFVVSG